MSIRQSIAALALAATATAAAQAAPSHCRQVEGDDRAFESAWEVAAGSVGMLRDVYRRVSHAAGLATALYLCNDKAVNAFAVEDPRGPHPRIVAVNTGLLRFVGMDADQLAAVLGHELAHLSLRHGARTREAKVAHLEVVARDWARELGRGGAERDAALRARRALIERARSVDRDAEREADDKGFSIAVRAGFDGAGASRFYRKWLEMQDGVRRESYLDTHPGLGERSGYSARLETNERFRRDAEKRLAAGDAPGLGEVVERWIIAVPDSGAAAYYGGLYLMMAGKPQALVSEAFEDAVTFFDGEGLSRLSQEDQYEARMASLALCVSLYREGRRRLALNCVQRLGHAEDVDEFRRLTGWSDFFVVPGAGARAPSGRPLFGAQSREGHLFMTNCSHVARERGLKDVRPWRGLREERPREGAAEVPLACNPHTCDCEPIDPVAEPTRPPRFDK